MKYLIFPLFLLPLCCFGQSVPGCYNYVAQTPITATSNATISGFSINCNGAATPGITIPAGVHDVHITKCKILNSATSNGLIYIGSGCYNITIDTCFFQSGYRGIYAVGATNNIHIWYNFFYNIIDPNVTATSSDGGGSSVQLNGCTGTSIQVLDNRSYHDISSAGVGDQFSLYKCNGTAASPIRICRNQALNGSTNPPSSGYAGAVAGDLGGGYQRVDSNIFVNTGAVGAQVQGGHDIEMSYNTIYLAQTTYTSVAIAFGNYSKLPSSNVTISYNNARCIQPSGNVFNFWYDSKTAYQPTGWSTNTTSTGLNANILPNPLWSACTLTVLPPNISYSPSAYTFTMGTAITSFMPSNSGSIASFTATLPPGLTIDPSTGTISGTPTIGSPPANYTVTAINTSGSSTATINIGVISTDASLSSLVLSNGTLSPTFCGCANNYTASVSNSVQSITLTPTVNQVNATVTVNGIPVMSGISSGAINLAVGANVISTTVTAQNGSAYTYTVTVTRAASTDASLSSLAISNGTLSPGFVSSTTSYTVNVDNSVSSITLLPTTNQSNAAVTVNGITVASGNASAPVNLAVGSNIITTVVTAQDGSTTQTYTVTVTRPAATTTVSFGALAAATYGDPPITLTASSNNTDAGAAIIYSSDNASVATVSGNTVTIVGAGAANITASEAATVNFSTAQNVTQTLVVNKAGLTVTAKDQHKIYGSLFTFNGTEFTTAGLIIGDVVNSVTLLSDGSAAPAGIGTYLITPGAATGNGLTNYNINYVPGTLTVNGLALTFATIPNKVYGTADFDPGATSSSPITYTSSNTAVTTIVNGYIHIVGAGSSTITANDGNTSIDQALTVVPAALTVNADNQTKAYGADNPPLTISYNGFVNGENGTNLNALPAISTNADANSIVGTYPITVNGAADPNYSITFNNGTLTVTKAPLSVKANNQSRTYGNPGPPLTVSYTGFMNNETAFNLDTLPIVSTTATISSPPGNYPITASGASGANYSISYIQGTMTINPVPLTFNSIPSQAYGSGDFNPGASGGSITYTSSNLAVATIVSGNIHIVGAGNTTVTANNGSTNAQQTLTVTPAPLTITANNQSKTYGSANPALTVSYNGFVNGDTPASLTTPPSITTTASTGSPAGAYSVTASGAASANYTISYVTGALTIGQAALTIKANDQTKIQGTANPALTVSYNGFVNSETNSALTIQPSITTTATSNSPVGTYPITASGATDANYNISYAPGTLTVTGIALSFGPIPSKVYGTADFNPGAASSSSITYTSSNTLVATIVAGNIHIVGVGTSTITANDGSATLQQTLTVTPATLSITANSVNKTYGNTLTGGTGSTAFTSTGLVNGETMGSVTLAYGTGSAATDATGAYSGSVTPSAATGGTFTASNYTITYTAGTITVTTAALTITANNQTKIQGATNPTLTVSYSGFVNNETNTVLTTQPTVTTTATTSSPVGTYPITASGATGTNYSISYVAGTLTVTAASTLTFNPIPSRVYGAANFNPGATSAKGSISYSSSNTAVATIVSGNIHIVGVGTSTITASNSTNSLQQILTVTKAPLTITGNAAKTYGSILTNGAGSTSFTSSGLVYSQTIGSVTMTYGTGSAATDAVGTYTGTAIPSAATGGTFVAANYTITYASGNIVVNKATLTITANSISKNYGTSIAGQTGSTAFIASGLKNGQTVGTVTIAYGTGATATSSTGNYSGSVTPSAAAGGTFIAADYTITYASGSITVNKIPLTITANNQVKIQGSANPTLTVSYSGFVNNETNASLSTQPKVTTTATTRSPVGTYPITASGAVDANYTISYVAGTLTINPSTAALLSVVNPLHETYVPVEGPSVRQAVSPNGDGINDVLHIDNIESYPDNKVTLMDRNGTPIFEITGYDNVNKVFDGHSNITMEMQKPGTYFYLLEYKVKGELKRKASYFVIKY